MPLLRLSAAAEQDVEDCLRHTHEAFGEQARLRYEALITQALRDIAADPVMPLSRERPELGPHIRSYHFRHSRSRVRSPVGAVRKPRHFALYRYDSGGIVGILHDAMELSPHLPTDYGDER